MSLHNALAVGITATLYEARETLVRLHGHAAFCERAAELIAGYRLADRSGTALQLGMRLLATARQTGDAVVVAAWICAALVEALEPTTAADWITLNGVQIS